MLAAGAGERFGGPKQIAELDGRPLLEHALAAMEAAAVDRRVVVLGARADEVRAAVPLRLRISKWYGTTSPGMPCRPRHSTWRTRAWS